ncbi:MAG: hypothetical protein FWF46_09310 [Oscillospiraceae bacterium]|nr:hypothetical protein [Oscillospiraceae bacterium]
MSKKKFKNILVITQLSILLIFGLFAIGSASSRELGMSNTDVYNTVRAGVQGGTCAARGFTYIGNFDQSECSSACVNAGYSAACTGENTTACFCK